MAGKVPKAEVMKAYGICKHCGKKVFIGYGRKGNNEKIDFISCDDCLKMKSPEMREFFRNFDYGQKGKG